MYEIPCNKNLSQNSLPSLVSSSTSSLSSGEVSSRSSSLDSTEEKTHKYPVKRHTGLEVVIYKYSCS